MANKPLPYVTAALLCEKVLQESDGSVSVVRIADKLQYRVQGLPPNVKPVIGIQGLFAIKAGDVTGDHTLTVVAEKPDGERKDVHTQPIKLLGKDNGLNLIINIGLGVDQNGLYWFDLLFDGELLSRAPLMVTPLPEQPTGEQKG